MDFDTKWTLPVGMLCVRVMLSPRSCEWEFIFADGEARGTAQHYRTVARIYNWRGEPSFGGAVDSAQGEMCHSGSGAGIMRREADEDDIRALVKLWDSRISIAEWLVNVTEYTSGLCAESKEMIGRAALEAAS